MPAELRLAVEPESLVLDAAPNAFVVGRAPLAVRIRDSTEPVPTEAPTWWTENDDVASVTAEGLVTARHAGRTRVVVARGDDVGVALVRVAARPETTIVEIAHRGYQAVFPENTLVAIAGAFAAGADGVEVDVRLTRDGEPVVIHDSTVDRTTDGRGAVSDLTLAQITSLDACARWRPRFPRCAVPTLRQALGALPADRMLVLHLYGPYDRHALLGLLGALRESGTQDRAMFVAWELRVLRDIRALDRAVPLGWLTSGLPWLEGVRELDHAAVITDQRALVDSPAGTRDLLAQGRALEVDIATFTIQTQAQAERLVALGLRTLVTDVPLHRPALSAARR